jgi:hypothetical protein
MKRRDRDLTCAAKDAARFSKIRQKYGLTKDRYYELLYKQNHRCAICYEVFDETQTHGIHIDHCHQTNVVRGALCGPCNVFLGWIEPKQALIDNCLFYLRSSYRLPIPPKSAKRGRKPPEGTPEEIAAIIKARRDRKMQLQRDRRAKEKGNAA